MRSQTKLGLVTPTRRRQRPTGQPPLSPHEISIGTSRPISCVLIRGSRVPGLGCRYPRDRSARSDLLQFLRSRACQTRRADGLVAPVDRRAVIPGPRPCAPIIRQRREGSGLIDAPDRPSLPGSCGERPELEIPRIHCRRQRHERLHAMAIGQTQRHQEHRTARRLRLHLLEQLWHFAQRL